MVPPDVALVRLEDCDTPALWAQVQADLAARCGNVEAFEKWTAEHRRLQPDSLAAYADRPLEYMRRLGAMFGPGYVPPTRAAIDAARRRLGLPVPDREAEAARQKAEWEAEQAREAAGGDAGTVDGGTKLVPVMTESHVAFLASIAPRGSP